jgi:DNA-binding transcriptional regulator GbsR (MarR family)
MEQEARAVLKRHMIDACVKGANNRGCCDAVGVLQGTLFLTGVPLSMDQLVEETGYSKSTVSTNMGILERIGLVKRVVIPGDKRYHYIPVTDADSLRGDMIANIRQNLQCILKALDRTEADLRAWESPDPSVMQRIEEIRHFYRQNDKLLDLISRHNTEDLIQLLETSF